MKKPFFYSDYANASAGFIERCGNQIVDKVTDHKTEYERVRSAAGITDFSFLSVFRIPEPTALDFLDPLLAGNVAKTRFGRVLHTFLADSTGKLLADCYVANNDEEFILICESLLGHDELWKMLCDHGAEKAGVVDCSATHTSIGIDGYKAWSVAKETFGADILGLPYLSIEVYPFNGQNIYFIRAGKTSEFGYLLIAPIAVAPDLFTQLLKGSNKQGGGLIGVSIHNDLRLEGRFFNIFSEGSAVGDPLVLGLQWMIDFEKETFCGHGPIMSHRTAGVEHKIIGVKSATQFAAGSKIFCGQDALATVVASCFSYELGAYVGLAVFPVATAYAGLSFHLNSGTGLAISTISMPPIMPKSLTVKLDEM